MRNVFSRRDFLKASAAAVLAASAAGVLTGCDGGGEQLAENEAILGDFKIQISSAQTRGTYVTSGGEKVLILCSIPGFSLLLLAKHHGNLINLLEICRALMCR